MFSSLGGLSFGKDGEGNVGYFGADGSLIPFKSGVYLKSFVHNKGNGGTDTVNILDGYNCRIGKEICLFVIASDWTNILGMVNYSGISIVSQQATYSTVNNIYFSNVLRYTLKITDDVYSFNINYGSTNSGSDRKKSFTVIAF